MPGDPGEGTGMGGGSSGGGSGGGAQESHGGGAEGAGPAIGESFDWRRRAQAAERQLEELKARFQEQLKDLEAQLVAARQQAGDSERRRELDAELLAAGALDLETARLLAEPGIKEAGGAGAVVAELRRRKPFLFRTPPSSGVMSADAGPFREGIDLAALARASGDRRALLRYLRSKRAK